MFHHACEASSMPGKPLWLMSQKCNGDQNDLVWRSEMNDCPDRNNLGECRGRLHILRCAASYRLRPGSLRPDAILCDAGHILSAASEAGHSAAAIGRQLQSSFNPGLPFRPRGPSYIRDLSPERTEYRPIRNGWWLRFLNPT